MSTRIEGIIDRLTDAESFDDIKWIVGDGIVRNYAQSIVDDHIKANAEFQGKAGLEVTVERVSVGKTCKWCLARCGKFTYPDVPKGTWDRHVDCDCYIIYDNGRVRQTLSGKDTKWNVVSEEVSERKKVGLTKPTAKELEARKIVGLETKPTIGNSIGVMFDNEPQEWFYNKLTDAEQMQIVSMQVNTTNLNRFLNDEAFAESLPEPIRKQYAEQVKTAEKALSKYKLEEPITVYRGVSEEEFTNTMWDDVATKSFKSTSYDENRAMAFAKNQGGYIIEYHIKPGNYGADVNGVPGANEKEFLINRGVPYKILSSKGNRMVIQIGD